MIRRSVSAALLLRDSFTGAPMGASSVQCELDGRSCKPLWKPGGYLVLADLDEGAHTLLLRSRGYQEETMQFTVRRGAVVEAQIALVPGSDYLFRESVTRLELALSHGDKPLAAAEVWVGYSGQAELRLAQEQAGAGERELRLFCRGAAVRLPIPGPFLLSDGKHSEIVSLCELHEERAGLDAPLARAHTRGKVLLPAQRYRLGPDGMLSAVFRTAGRVELLAGEHHGALELAEGENHLSLAL